MANIFVICLCKSKKFIYVCIWRENSYILFLCDILGPDWVGGGKVLNNGKGEF